MNRLDKIVAEAAKRYLRIDDARIAFIEGAWWASGPNGPGTEVEKSPNEVENLRMKTEVDTTSYMTPKRDQP